MASSVEVGEGIVRHANYQNVSIYTLLQIIAVKINNNLLVALSEFGSEIRSIYGLITSL